MLATKPQLHSGEMLRGFVEIVIGGRIWRMQGVMTWSKTCSLSDLFPRNYSSM